MTNQPLPDRSPLAAVRQLLKDRPGISVTRLAHHAKVQRSTVSRVLNAKSDDGVTWATMRAIVRGANEIILHIP